MFTRLRGETASVLPSGRPHRLPCVHSMSQARLVRPSGPPTIRAVCRAAHNPRCGPSPGMLEMHRTWALQTVNWSTTVPGWLASMMTTLLVVRVLVRIHTRLHVASGSGSSFACFQVQERGLAPNAGHSTSHKVVGAS